MNCGNRDCAFCRGRGAMTHHYRVRMTEGLFFHLRDKHRNVAAYIREVILWDIHEHEGKARRGER